jgi:glycosyltransferase involved in cell wall biosynthesis
MKICHVFPFFSIKYFGGTSDWMYKLTKAQADAGMEPVILTGDYLFDQELADSIPNVKFRILPSYMDKAGFSIMPALFSFCCNELPGYDVVHMHVFRTFQNAVLGHYCRKLSIPYIVDAHGAVPYHSRKPVIKRLFDSLFGKKMLRSAKAIIAETETGVDDYIKIVPDIKKEDIVVLPPPFDTEEFQNLPAKGLFRKKFNIPEEKKIIMFLGRVHEIKGNDALIEGFGELLKHRDDVILVIVGGDDGHMETCKQIASDLSISDSVIFAGFLGGSDKNEALVDADIVAQMSRYEQGAWAPIEAVLAGTPIIVSDHTGAGEDVRRLKAGYTAEFGNKIDLSKKLDNILNEYEDALELTSKAKELIEREHSLDARIGEFRDLYEYCTKNTSR